ncbi:Hsp70 family protein [Gordonia desulfuricans]|uniref:Hsp70 family protein n=2 Tax=Gordonia desulfuricans TaxID=89051 RepID=A0A7K3LW02_9ACTN|nr:Hsp70 family protein [Gordonia desulfuricans]NDK92465.1 Hsp70 family protein [Gordonia desulfuricans]
MVATALGVSLGTRNLRACTFPPPVEVVTRHSAVLTSIPNQKPEVGTPEENPRSSRGGVTLAGFVERVGDPVPLTAPDGSAHRPEAVTATAVASVMRTLAPQFRQSPPVVVGYPAHWTAQAVDALRGALPEAGVRADAHLESDLTCALAQLGTLADMPRTGLLAVVDAGASGTSVAVADPATGSVVGDVVRVDEPSGDDLDHAVMRFVLSEVIDDPTVLSNPDANLTAALTGLRRRCRAAKEELSRATVAMVDVDLPVYRGDVRITRTEFEDLLGDPLSRLGPAIREALDRAGRATTDLTAIAAIGGGASIGLLTQQLSGEFHLPVLTERDPASTVARGAARIAGRSAPPMPAPRGSADTPVRGAPDTASGRGMAGAAGVAGAAAGGLAGAAGARPSVPESPHSSAIPVQPRSSAIPVQPRSSAIPVQPRSGAIPAPGTGHRPPPTPPPADGGAHTEGGPPVGNGPRRPVLSFTDTHEGGGDDAAEADTGGGHRRRALIVAGTAIVLALSAGTVWAVTHDDGGGSTPPATVTTTTEASTTTTETTPAATAPEVGEEPQVGNQQVPTETATHTTEPSETEPSVSVTTEPPPVITEPIPTGGAGGGATTAAPNPGAE